MSDEKPFAVPLTFDKLPAISERINGLYRSLMRHRERYVRAWIAHYGARPEQVSLVESWMDSSNGRDLYYPVKATTFSVRFVKDTDDVAELVEAAQRVLDAEDRYEDRYLADVLDPLEDALKKFKRQP